MFQTSWSNSSRATAFALVSVLLVAPPAEAQVSSAGLKIGAAQSSMTFVFGDCPADAARECVEAGQANQPRRSVAVGAAARVHLNQRLSLQPELLYARKGYEVTGPTLHLSYVELPILLRAELRAREARGLRPFVYGGPAPAFMFHCTVFGTSVDGPYRERCGPADSLHSPGEPAAYDVGLVAGGGIGYRGIEMEVRHTRSLIDIGAWESAQRSSNRALTVLLGYSLAVDW